MPILSDADVGIGTQAPTLMNDADVGLGAPAQTGSPGLMGALQRVWQNPPAGPSLIGAAKSLFQSAQLPGDVMAGRVDPLSEQGIARATQLAGNIALGGPGGGMFGAAAAPKLAASKLPSSQQVIEGAGQLYDSIHRAASGTPLTQEMGPAMRLFHGSDVEGLDNLKPKGTLGAVHMTDRSSYANQYGSNIYEADVPINRIKESDFKGTYALSPNDVAQLRSEGYDAVRRRLFDRGGYEYAILNPDLIKNVRPLNAPRPGPLETIANDIRSSLNAAGNRPSVAKPVHDAINELETPATKGAPDVGDLVAARKTLGKLLGTEHAAAAGMARDLLDAKIGQVAPDVLGALKLADRQYNIGMTAKGVEDAAKAAENAALSRQTGLKTPMQTEFRQLAKKNPYSGLTPQEQAQMFRVGGGTINRALQIPAAMDPTASRLAALIHGATAAGTVGASVPAQVALGTGGLAARKLMEANIRARAADVARSVLQRSDLGQKALAAQLAQPKGSLGLAQAILAGGRSLPTDWLTRLQTTPEGYPYLQAQ